MPNEQDDQAAVLPPDDSVVAGKGDAGPAEAPLSYQPPTNPVPGMSPVVAQQVINALFAPDNSVSDAVASNLTPQHITEMINQRGRASDQNHSFRKLALAFAAFLVLVVVGIIVFMTVNERPDLLREIIFGIGGLFSGLVAGAGGGYGYANRRR